MKVIILGAGGRGNVYARYCYENGVEIAGLADPNTSRLEKLAQAYEIPKENLYQDWQTVLSKPKFADAVINATTDLIHYESTMKAMELGYHILLEKPISPSEAECRELVETAKNKKLIFMVCHVLRYAPFFEKIKEIVESGEIGDILNFQLTENVANWHFAHSYVRGVFRNEKISSPVILAKSCHDLDIISYIMNKKCVSAVSEGALTYFTEKNKPQGAPAYCLDGCPHEKNCPYFAPKQYLSQINAVGWPTTIISTDTSFAARYKALEKGPYGRCVFQCDNDVLDHQSAIFTMEDGTTATFNLTGLSSENTRILRIYGTKGDLRGHLDKNEIIVSNFNTKESKTVEFDTVASIISSHGGGDYRLVKDFVDAVSGKGNHLKTSGELSLQSHLMAFAAEKSRKTGQRITL